MSFLLNAVVQWLFGRPFTLMDDDELNYALPLFLAEVLKKDGSVYPPATLRAIVLSLQKHLEMIGRDVRFLTDTKFKPVRDTLDARMKWSASLGLGVNHRQTAVITTDMENELWDRELLGDHSPQVLLDTMVYIVGRHFALRGRDELRRLRFNPPQITVHTSSDGRRYLEYHEVCTVCFYKIN